MTEIEQLFSQWQDLQPINEVYSPDRRNLNIV